MSDNELFRVTKNGVKTYGPYDTLYMARNVASQRYGGYWAGRNGQIIRKYGNGPEGRAVVSILDIKIQKLTPVLKPLEGGSLQLDLEWVDLP